MPKRVSFLVDGFNVYHSLKDLQKLTGKPLKWLDLRALCESYTQQVRSYIGDRVEIADIHYFSAIAEHLQFTHPGHIARHKDYIAALESTGVKVHLSRFKFKQWRCPVCGKDHKRAEEKETDVAIAVQLLETFARSQCQVAVIVSGDTDFLPAVRAVKGLFGDAMQVGIAFPFGRRNNEPQTTADFYFQVQQKHIEKAQFPSTVRCSDGTMIQKPRGW